MASRIVTGAREAVDAAARAAKHVAWYFSYRMDGAARDDAPGGRPARRLDR